jgi:glycosyltransferase involved in cell wall biosynthesis
MLLKAFVELNLWEHGYKLVLVGRYDWSNRDFDDYYKSLEENIKNSVLIITASYSELVELYKNAKLFVFPSFAEGFGIPPLEAIAFDCPLLCSKATAMSEFNLDEDFYFDPSNLDELKSKMLYLINSKPNLNAIKKTVLNQYDWQIMADKLYDLIQSDYTTNLR